MVEVETGDTAGYGWEGEERSLHEKFFLEGGKLDENFKKGNSKYHILMLVIQLRIQRIVLTLKIP